jgi:hypothetical protein
MPTKIYLFNLVNTLGVETVVSGGLAPSAFKILAGKVPNQPPGSRFFSSDRVIILQFNRNIGVKDGHTYTFQTFFTVGTMHFLLVNKLTGTATSSNYTAQLTVTNGSVSAHTPVVSDQGGWDIDPSTGALENKLTGNSKLLYRVTLDRIPTLGGYQHIVMTIAPATQAPTE